MKRRHDTDPRRVSKSVCAALLLAWVSASSLAAQDTTDVAPSAWVVGGSIGVPVFATRPELELFTIGGHGTRVQPGRIGADVFVGTMPRIVVAGGLPIGARAGVVLPLPVSDDVLLLPSGGVSLIGVVSRGGGGTLSGVNLGVAALRMRPGRTGFRAGVTWNRFRGVNGGVWLVEVGLVRRR